MVAEDGIVVDPVVAHNRNLRQVSGAGHLFLQATGLETDSGGGEVVAPVEGGRDPVVHGAGHRIRRRQRRQNARHPLVGSELEVQDRLCESSLVLRSLEQLVHLGQKDAGLQDLGFEDQSLLRVGLGHGKVLRRCGARALNQFQVLARLGEIDECG